MKTVSTLALTIAILLAAGSTAAMAKMTATAGADLAPGTYYANMGKNVLTIKDDNTFKLETPMKTIEGTIKKQSMTSYMALYTDPKTGDQIPKMFTYDPQTKTIRVQGEGGVQYKMK